MPAFLTPAVIRLIVLGAAFLAFGGFCAYRMHAHDQIELRALQSEFDTFKGGVAALGKAAEDRKVKQEADDLKRKQNADKENKDALAVANRSIAELRKRADSRPGRGELPKPPATSSRPDLACFDRAEYQREDGILTQRLLQGARGLADEGTEATIDLNTAKAWAR